MRHPEPEDDGFGEINITPLTDVILVLLIIFIVISPALVQGAMQVSLPEARSAESAPRAGVVVRLAADAALFVDDHPTAPDSLLPVLQRRLAASADRTVIVEADRQARHGQVVMVLDAVKRAGAARLLVAASPVARP